VYPTTQLLKDVALVSIKNNGTRETNYENCIADSRPDRITPVSHCIGGSNDVNSVYTTTHLLKAVALFCIKNEVSPENNYGNCIAASRPDRITAGTFCIGGSND
jgi:hypothetical protein